MDVSVIIPTYNRKMYVREAIDSILSQTYTNYEIIVIDDGSMDGTGAYLQAHFGNRIRFLWQQNQGESVARNRGIELASGKYIAFLDSDDLWLPEKTAEQISFLDANPHIGLLTCQIWYVDKQGDFLSNIPALTDLHSDDFVFEKLVISNFIPGPSTVIVRKHLLDQYGGFDPDIRFGEDWDLWLRLLDHTDYAIIAKPLACLRRHQQTQSYYASAANNQRKLSDHIRLLERAFSQKNGQVNENLRGKALANQYRNTFLSELAVGNKSLAVENMAKAKLLDTEIIKTLDFPGQVVLSALRYSELEGNNLDDSALYIQNVLEALRSVFPISANFEHQLWADFYLACVYTTHRQGNLKSSRYYCLKSFQKDYRIIFNRGFVSIFVESIIGTNLKNTISGLYKDSERGHHD